MTTAFTGRRGPGSKPGQIWCTVLGADPSPPARESFPKYLDFDDFSTTSPFNSEPHEERDSKNGETQI